MIRFLLEAGALGIVVVMLMHINSIVAAGRTLSNLGETMQNCVSDELVFDGNVEKLVADYWRPFGLLQNELPALANTAYNRTVPGQLVGEVVLHQHYKNGSGDECNP